MWGTGLYSTTMRKEYLWWKMSLVARPWVPVHGTQMYNCDHWENKCWSETTEQRHRETVHRVFN